MDEKDKKQINGIYEKIADELNISESVFESARKSYQGLGEYLSEKISDYKVEVFPQGSMNLGTLIKPVSSDDDYDLDVVCKIYHDFNSPGELKKLVGDALKESGVYSKLLVKDEGKRCWKLKYADSAHFHMDILPSKPNYNLQNKSIIITNKEDGEYTFKDSNPEGYADWFNGLQEKERRSIFEKNGQKYPTNIKYLKKFNVRTTLQKTIQLLKRHRDVKYSNLSDSEKENKPISIIITTLVGYLYKGDESIFDLICKFVNNFQDYIIIDSNGKYFIPNPVNVKENFADKWEKYPERQKAFYSWVNDLKRDLVTNNFMKIDGLVEKGNYLKNIFGSSVVESIFTKDANDSKKKYIRTGEVATLTTSRTDTEVKKHNFYGK